MSEIEFKEKLIKDLQKKQLLMDKYNAPPLSEDFIRGYIFGAEDTKGLELPPHWYPEMVRKVQGSEL